MKAHEDTCIFSCVSALRTGALVLPCVVLCICCYSCRSSSSASRVAAADRHEVFDSSAALDSLAQSGTVSEHDSSSVDIREQSADTIKIERDEAGRPVLIIRHYGANLLGSLESSRLSDFGFTGFHITARNESAGTVDSNEQAQEETRTELDPAIPLESIIGPVLLVLGLLYVIYITIADVIWPRLKK